MEVDDPYRFPPLHFRFRSAHARRRHPVRELSHHGRPPGRLRRRPGRALRGVGAERRSGQRGGRLQRLGRAPPPHAQCASRRLGDSSFLASAPGTNYKYSVRAPSRGYRQQKADPYGFATEVPPKSASVVCDLADLPMGRPALDGVAGAQRLSAKSRSPSTKCTSAPGCAGRTIRI